MRHAFLIIAHNNWWQLRTLIRLLDEKDHDLYIHIDKKSRDFVRSDFEGIAEQSRLCFYQEYKVYWGGYSQVETELFLFEKAHEERYDYYHLISGGDLPLKSNIEIDGFFERNKGKQFIEFDEEKLKEDPEICRRTRLYHCLQNYRRAFRCKWLNAVFTFLERVLLGAQILVGVNREKVLDWVIQYGSNWVSITDELVETLLGEREKIRQIFSYTNCADELFVQTVAYNCGFKESVYTLPDGRTSNMRFIDWGRGRNGNPYTFRMEDEELLGRQEALFARKFSEGVDRGIIERLSGKRLAEKKNG